MLKKRWIRNTLWLVLVLTPVAFALFVLKVSITLRLMLEVVGVALLFVPLSMIAAILIAKVTPEWSLRRDLILIVGGFSLLWAGLRCSPPIGTPIFFLGLILTAATMVLTPARKAVKEGWPGKSREVENTIE